MEGSGNLRRFSLLAAVLAVACGTPTASESDAVLSLVVVPDAVQPGDSLRAVFTVVNPTRYPLTLTLYSTCTAQLTALRDGQRVILEGTSFACGARITKVTIAPLDSLVRVYPLVAMLQESGPPYEYVIPPPIGTYTLRAMPEWDVAHLEYEFEVLELGGAT